MRNKTTTILSIIIFSIITSCSEKKAEVDNNYGVDDPAYKTSLTKFHENIIENEEYLTIALSPESRSIGENDLRLSRLEFYYLKDLSKKMPLKEAIKEAYKLASLDILKNPS